MLLNDAQFVEAARALAEGVLKRFPQDAAARNREAFRALIGREPDATESAILARHFAEQRDLFAKDPEGAKSLLSVGESPWDEALGTADFAAMTAVASLIMNFDEFIVLR